jgi:RNA polymerase sigma factor (sigma-70 family)
MTYQPVSLQELLSHQGWALQVARRLVHEESEAEDLVQRTWIAALRSPPNTARGARAWIRKVILNLARERHRRALVRERHERSSAVEATAPDAFESLSRSEIHRLLGEHLLELSEPYRSAVILRYYEGLSSAEIARRQRIPAGTVRWRLKIGLDQLRTELDRRSHGDRTRWVSALLVFLPPEMHAPPEREPREGQAEEPEASAAPAGLAASLAPAAAWIALALAGALGVLWLVQDPRGSAHAAEPSTASLTAPTAEALDDDAGRARRTPTDERAALDSAAEIPAPPAGLRIVVLDEAGIPLAGATILVARKTGFEERATSDEDGLAFLVPEPADVGSLGIPATEGRVALRALAEGRAASPLVHVAAPFAPEHEVRLVVGGPEETLTGHILDELGEPIPGALVTWFDPLDTIDNLEGDFTSPSYLSAVTAADGSFTIAHLTPGRGHFGCLAKGFPLYSSPFDTRTMRRPMRLRLGRGGTVTGVVFQPDGRPAAGVRVACEPLLKAAEWAIGLPGYELGLRGFSESTTSDEQGRFRLTGIGTWQPRRMWARDGENAATIELSFANGSEEGWNPVLGETTGYRLRLVDEHGEPLPRWVAHLRRPMTPDVWWIRRLAADAEGRVQIPDSPEGEAFLDVFGPNDLGASYAWRRIQPSADEQVIMVETGVTSSISGRVLGESGLPELDGQLALHSLQTALVTRIGRDAQGNFDQRIAPGSYALVLQLEQTATPLGTFTLAPGERETLGTFSTPPMGFLRLNGVALGGYRPTYSLFRLSDNERVGAVLEVGNGPLAAGEVLIPVFPGRYRVLAFDGENAKPIRHDVVIVAHAETRLNF